VILRCPIAWGVSGSPAPSVTITSPASAFSVDVCTTTLTVAGTCSDATEVSLYTSTNGSTYTLVGADTSVSSGAWSVDATITSWATGARYLRADATGPGGTTSSTVVVGTITDAPSVAITSPSASFSVDVCTTTLSVSGTCSAATEVSLYTSTDGTSYTLAGNDESVSSGAWSLDATITSWATGARYLRADATGPGGTTSSTVVVGTITDGATALLALTPRVVLLAGLTGTAHMTLASGLITQWSDVSGNSTYAAQATTADKPAAAASGGDTYASFDCTTDTNGQGLQFTTNSWLGGATVLTLTLAMRVSTSSALQYVFSHYAYALAISYTAAGALRVYVGSSAYGECAFSAGVDSLVTVVFDGAGADNVHRLIVEVNGVQQTLSFTGTIGASLASGGSAAIGWRSSTVGPMTGRIYHMVAWTSVLSSANRTTARTALGNLLNWM
jgi:hypothetical protein